MRRGAFILLASFGSCLLVLLVFEIGGRIFLGLRAPTQVIFLEPDRELGWRQVPGHEYVWTGQSWYPADFSVAIRVNAHGYRDLERVFVKPEDTTRIVLLGDSFVEAMQVPIEQTAAQLLQKMLDENAMGISRFEVLNFAVSNFGIGQYLLSFEQTAHRFEPDHVIIFVAGYLMARSVMRYETTGFSTTQVGKSLWVRPTFLLEGGELVREPAADFDEFVRVQRELIRDGSSGERTRARLRSVVAHFITKWLRDDGSRIPEPPPDRPSARSSDDVVGVGLALIRELNNQVRRTGARLTVVDTSEYFDRSARALWLTRQIRALCSREDIAYVPLSAALLEANRHGRSTRWRHDGHFNELGNEIFAETLFQWLWPQLAAR